MTSSSLSTLRIPHPAPACGAGAAHRTPHSALFSWRDAILKDFVPNVSKLTLVADPDSLLSEETLALELRQRGFELIEFNDPVEFRYAYESKYRSIWDQGGLTDLVVVLRLVDSDLESLPYDLLQAGRRLAFNLGSIFPDLSYPVVEKLDRFLLDSLFDAQRKFQPGRAGDNGTKDFILLHVFGVAAGLIGTDVDLLRTLLRLHYNKTRLPQILAERLNAVLASRFPFSPMKEIIMDSEAFFAFLQSRWRLFLSAKLKESKSKLTARESGPIDHGILPFDHQDIRIYIDNLFVEGTLKPIPLSSLNLEPGALNADCDLWIRSGILGSKDEENDARAFRLIELVEKSLPVPECRHSDWIAFALKWAELSSLIRNIEEKSPQTAAVSFKDLLNNLRPKVNSLFTQWLDTHYATLINLPPTNPAMPHHVPRRLARELEDAPDGRVALVVVDGLALDQWVSVRRILHEQYPDMIMRESAAFAWIPTLTSVSRQALFSGKPPIYFPGSIHTTQSEGSLWRQFWEGVGLSRMDAAYQRGLGDGDIADALGPDIHPEKTKALGLVIDKVDKIMHGMQLKSAGMHNQIKQWCRGGFLGSLISHLLDQDYQVWMTSDHGNIECFGRGRPSEGGIAETRGERVRVYPTPELRASVAGKFPFSREWRPVGLPQGYYPLLASGDDAFLNNGETVVGHGGVSVEEVIVPLVKFERKKTDSCGHP